MRDPAQVPREQHRVAVAVDHAAGIGPRGTEDGDGEREVPREDRRRDQARAAQRAPAAPLTSVPVTRPRPVPPRTGGDGISGDGISGEGVARLGGVSGIRRGAGCPHGSPSLRAVAPLGAGRAPDPGAIYRDQTRLCPHRAVVCRSDPSRPARDLCRHV
ncbi:hypothetical protein FMEAI12_3380038 [Parafrankia sp. Ea1.12]|nr:hypothetical protein FMEAI12_3380038 [Parafrankia sp. Ea1.12]